MACPLRPPCLYSLAKGQVGTAGGQVATRNGRAAAPNGQVRARFVTTCRRLIRGGCDGSSRGYDKFARTGVFYSRGRHNDSISLQHHLLRTKCSFGIAPGASPKVGMGRVFSFQFSLFSRWEMERHSTKPVFRTGTSQLARFTPLARLHFPFCQSPGLPSLRGSPDSGPARRSSDG